MTSLREKYQMISQHDKFSDVVANIKDWNLDINKQDEKGRTLLFYMIDASSCFTNVTIKFIEDYKPQLHICDNYGQTVFFRFMNTVDHEFYMKNQVSKLIDYILNITPELVLLRKDKKNRSTIKFLTKIAMRYFNTATSYPYVDNNTMLVHQSLFTRLSHIINQISIHINKRCSFFNIMYSNSEKLLKQNHLT